MVDATHISYPANERSYYSVLKREIHLKVKLAGFTAQQLGELDIIVAEMTSNLHKYAKDGEILAGIVKNEGEEYIELISIDNGPGMIDAAKFMVDGFSTTSTLGQGLGSIKRLSDKFDLFSVKGWGTIILSRIYKKQTAKTNKKDPVEITRLVVAKPGEKISGDGTFVMRTEHGMKLLVADGLGHGILANDAVNTAVKSFEACTDESPAQILRHMHQDLRKTRGMVAMVSVFDFPAKTLRLAGVGNIAARFLHFSGNGKNQISYNGIVGHNIPNTINDQQISFNEYSLLVLCSDGIQSRWDIAKYSGIGKCDLSVLAAAIYKDYSRRNDDNSVIIVKLR